MRKCWFILTVTVFLLGCAINKPITPTQFMFRCIMKPTPGYGNSSSDSCGEQNRICRDFQSNMLDAKDMDSCMQICRETKNFQYQRFVTDNCRWTAREAYDLCTLYCMSNFD